MKFQIELSGSQLMALRTIVVTHMHFEQDAVSIDCSVDPPVETKPEELLQILMEALPVNHKVGT